MQTEFIELAKAIHEQCRGGPIYYITNPGNLGDGLIRAGTRRFFRKIKINYYELHLYKNRFYKIIARYLPLTLKGNLIYGGGGGWCHIYGGGARLIKIVASFYSRVIVLPSTYEMSVNLPNTTFFCRDKYESKQAMPEAIFCHDMAFFLSPQPSQKGQGDGFFFRTDKESAGKIDLPPGNIDISLQGNQYSSPLVMFEALSRYETISTDRLHVAIAACLLGKETHFYQGGYFKNKAVYLSSMEGVHRNVHFHDL